MIESIKKFFKNHTMDLGLTISAVLLTCLFQWLGFFDFLELKTYDYRFHKVRGPLTGWRASDSTIIDLGTDVVLVEVDDETWRIMKDNKIPWPYPRGDIWTRVVDNLSKAGAKVIAFDIQFDAPDARSEYLRSVTDRFPDGLPDHGDILLGESIRRAQENGTAVVMDVKMVREPTRIPPTYIAYPVKEIMDVNPETGLVNDMMDIDGFSRQYSIAGYMDHEPKTAYLTLGVKCVKAFQGIPDDAIPLFDPDKRMWSYGDLKIPSYGRTNNFLVNYYGPPSGYKMPGRQDVKAWGTYLRYSLSQILDTEDYDLPEDLDWMEPYIGGIPDWIENMEDEDTKKSLMEEFSSPFKDKIVIVGVSVEVIPDVKSTPFYNYMNLSQLTPGMETHANAIQTILHENYLTVFGGKTTRFLSGGLSYPIAHFILILILCIVAYGVLSLAEMHPVISGIIILFESVIYFGIACGMFTNDYWWLLKSMFMKILPHDVVDKYYAVFQSGLPEPGDTFILPIVAPIVGIVLTYSGNVIYQFLHEQKDKKFLKATFGTYIAPKIIDKMYEEKQAPKLGGVEGYHTAFFSDIQNFSTFSEALEPERMVALMNEYLTVMTDVILSHEGTLDKYIGDAIVAFYGAPAPVLNQEKKSCETALAMQDALGDLRKKWESEGDWPEIVYSMLHRIGLNSGKMVTGNMGSEVRMNYTMMGDTVNLAARLESSAKQYGIYTFVGENVYEATKDDFMFRFIDFVQVKGKSIPVKVYELLSWKDEADLSAMELIKMFEDGLDHYFQQKWDDAINLFKMAEEKEEKFKTRNTNPSAVFIERCNLFKDNPPGKEWDGVWTMTSK